MIYICYLISFLSFILLIFTIKETRKVLKLSALLFNHNINGFNIILELFSIYKNY